MRLEFCGLILAGVIVCCAAITNGQPPAPSASATASNNAEPFPSRVLRQTTFNIPFTVETARQPLEVQLHLSRDRGKTWKLYARQNPSARFFPFHATEDGEYWFASQTIDAARAAPDMAGRQPELHVVIDTIQPQFDFQAAVGSAREIQISWRASDPTLDPASLKIEYQAGREQPWQPVEGEPSMQSGGTAAGRLTFVPRTAWVELQVRAEISDLAKNKAVVTRRLTLAVAAASPNTQRPNTQGDEGWRPVTTNQPDSSQRPVALPPTTPQAETTASSDLPVSPRPDGGYRGNRYPVSYGAPPGGYFPASPFTPAEASEVPADPYADARPSAANASSQAASAPRATASTANAPQDTDIPGAIASPETGQQDTRDAVPTTEWKPNNPRPQTANNYGGDLSSRGGEASPALGELVGGSGYQPQTSPVHPLVSQQIAAGSADQQTGHGSESGHVPRVNDRPDRDATTPSPLRTDSNRVSQPELRMTSATRFELDYEFDAAAANGVRSVELWGTSDQGQTWSRWQVDEDRRSPLEVQIDAEGTYGFRVVIVGNNGLAGEAPRNGDDAELWIGVDTTPPSVRLTTATYGEGEHAGKLDIRWNASDPSFGDHPISIFFSENPAGPWTTIAAGVPNSGTFFWPIDPRAPEQLYLRIEARDRAGNQSEYRLADPVNLAGFTPKARIRGFRPVSRTPVEHPSNLDSAPQARRDPNAYR